MDKKGGTTVNITVYCDITILCFVEESFSKYVHNGIAVLWLSIGKVTDCEIAQK